MKNALLLALGILALASIGFASTDTAGSTPDSDKPVATGVQTDNSPTADRLGSQPNAAEQLPFWKPPIMASSATSPLVAERCRTSAESGAPTSPRTNNPTGPDECARCWLDCQRAWRNCRRYCAAPEPGAWIPCHEGCVDDLLWCQNTYCEPDCP